MSGTRLTPPKPSTRPRARTLAGHMAGLAIVALLGVAGAGVVTGPALAQSQGGGASAPDRAQTLASIRKELNGLYGQIDSLKRELNQGGAGGQPAPAAGSSTQERLDAITAQLQQLTNQTEELQHRVQTVVNDGSRRINDLNFRLCELEKGCDIAKLKTQPKLGLTPTSDTPQDNGGAGGQGASANGQSGGAAAPQDLAVGEQADFDRAKAALDKGDYQQAANLFGTFTQTYTAGPLTGQAHFYRGQALTAMGKTADAARAYLNSFSGSPDGVRAADALTKLGISLGKLGQTQDACVTLGQVKVRYPSSSAVADAAAARQTLGCQ